MGLPPSVPGWKPWARIVIWCVGILAAQSGMASDLAHNLLGWVTGVSSDNGRSLHFVAQKIFHVVLFGGFGALVPLPSTRTGWSRLLLAAFLFSAGSEMLQFMSPGRSPRIFDIFLNIFSCFVPLYWRVRRKRVVSGPLDA